MASCPLLYDLHGIRSSQHGLKAYFVSLEITSLAFQRASRLILSNDFPKPIVCQLPKLRLFLPRIFRHHPPAGAGIRGPPRILIRILLYTQNFSTQKKYQEMLNSHSRLFLVQETICYLLRLLRYSWCSLLGWPTYSSPPW